MNKKVKGLMLAGGILAGLGTLVPMASYAADSNVSVVVSPTLTATAAVSIDSEFADAGHAGSFVFQSANKTATGTIDVAVTTNSKFSIGFSADEPNLVDSNAGNSDKILIADNGSGTTNCTVNPGANCWGIQHVAADGVTSTGSYVGFSNVKSNPTVFFTASTPASKTVKFPLGISISPSLSAGTYSTTVTVTVAEVN